jgi:uncharacterized protein involved in copper resistance
MRTNLYKKVLGAALGAVLTAAAVGVSAQTDQPTTPSRQDKQEKPMCPMMKDAKMGKMDISEMKGMDMSKMDMSKMKEYCQKMMGAMKNERPAATEEKKSEHQPGHKM